MQLTLGRPLPARTWIATLSLMSTLRARHRSANGQRTPDNRRSLKMKPSPQRSNPNQSLLLHLRACTGLQPLSVAQMCFWLRCRRPQAAWRQQVAEDLLHLRIGMAPLSYELPCQQHGIRGDPLRIDSPKHYSRTKNATTPRAEVGWGEGRASNLAQHGQLTQATSTNTTLHARLRSLLAES